MPSTLRLSSIVLCATIFLAGCAGQSQSTATSRAPGGSVRRQIEDAAARFSAAFNRGDIAALAAMYDTAAVVMAPNAPPMRGRQNIETFWNGARQQGFRSLELTVDQVEQMGSHAVEIGRYTLVIQPPGGGELMDRGKYLVIWRRQGDGSWKLYRDIFNSSMPAR